MKHTVLLLLVSLAFLPVSLWGQEGTGVSVKRERVFTGTGLYGFMNGGTDLFLEYGVEKLTTRDIVYKEMEYTLDIYEMDSPLDAFGIYSLHTFKCLRTDTAECINCLSTYQLQATAGNRYISLVFPSGTAAARSFADELLHLYVPTDEAEPVVIPSALNLPPPYSSQLKFLRGPISLSGTQQSLIPLLEGISYSGLWYIADQATRQNRALILLSAPQDIPLLQKRIPATNILSVGTDYLYILCPDQEGKEDYGPFGF